MRIVISILEKIFDIDNVVLKDGYLPSVRGYCPLDKDSFPEIEPALWFKCDIYSDIFFDCNCQTIKVKLNEEPLVDGDTVVYSMRTVCADFSCHVQYDVAEVFQTIASLPLSSNRPNDIESVNKGLLRILHFCIFPILKIVPNELPFVKHVLSNLNKCLTDLNQLLEKMSTEIAGTKKALNEKRMLMVDDLQNLTLVTKYPHEILLVLESTLQDDVKMQQQSLEIFQQEVNEAKQKVDSESILENKRKSRNDCYQKHLSLIQARENIVNALASAPRKRQEKRKSQNQKQKFGTDAKHTMYLRVYDFLQEQRSKRYLFNHKKDFVMSVRAAAEETIKELICGKNSSGLARHHSQHLGATDILHKSLVPKEWRSISDQVALILCDNSHALTKKHNHFIKTVKDQCAGLLNRASTSVSSTDSFQRERSTRQSFCNEMQSLIVDSAENDPVRDAVFSTIKSRSPSWESISLVLIDPDQVPVSEPDIIDTIKKELKSIQEIIHAHFDFMCSEFQVILDAMSYSTYYKIWLCYESDFYRETLDSIIAVFNVCYSNICENLRLSVLGGHFSHEHLDIQETWILDMLVDSGDAGQSEGVMPLDKIVSNIAGVNLISDENIASISEDTENYNTRSNCSQHQWASFSSIRSESDRYSCKFDRIFRPAIDTIKYILKEKTVMHKLELMTKCIRLIQDIVTKDYMDQRKTDGTLLCCDDFLSILPLLLSRTGADTMAAFYPQVTMLVDFMAPFLATGIHANSLTHFYSAYHLVFSMILTKKSKQ